MAAFAFVLPDKLKIRHKLGKAVLRHWLARAMPAAHPYAKKRGFTVPVGEWIAFKGQRIGHMVGAQECIQAICAPDAVQDVFALPVGRAGKAAWTLLFYALWHKIHIQGVAPDGDVFDVLSA
jgi:asparagine synthase (glutamine-hydrolysing)